MTASLKALKLYFYCEENRLTTDNKLSNFLKIVCYTRLAVQFLPKIY